MCLQKPYIHKHEKYTRKEERGDLQIRRQIV